MNQALLIALLISLAGNVVLVQRLTDARGDEADAIQACETRIEAGARAASEAAREAERAAFSRREAELAAEAERARAAVGVLRRGMEAISNDRDTQAEALRQALSETVDDCASRVVPRSLLDRVHTRPDPG